MPPVCLGMVLRGGGQMVPPAHPRHAAICFVTRLPGWRSRPPPWWTMVGSLRESISSYATIYAPAAAHCVDHCSLIAPPSATYGGLSACRWWLLVFDFIFSRRGCGALAFVARGATPESFAAGGAHAPLCLLNFLGSSRTLGVVSRSA